MKKYSNIRRLFAALLMLTAFNCMASDLKIGLVDRQVLNQESLYAKDYMKKMKKEFEARQEDLVAREKEIKSKSEALRRDKEILSEKEFAKKETEITKLQQKLIALGEEFQSDVNRRTEKENKVFEKALDSVLTNLAKEEKLDLILQNNMALFNTGKADFTYKALKYLDKHFNDTHAKT